MTATARRSKYYLSRLAHKANAMKIRIPSSGLYGFTFSVASKRVTLTGLNRYNQIFSSAVRNDTRGVDLEVTQATRIGGAWVLEVADTTGMADGDTLSVVVSVDDQEAIFHAVQQAIGLLDAKQPVLFGGRVPVEPLGIPGVARQLAAGAASTNVALTAGVNRVSLYARGADIRYAVGSSSQTASGTSHFIALGERLDIDVPATANIAAIRAGSVDGTLEITELS